MTTICIGVPSYRRAAQLNALLDRLMPLIAARPHIRLCIVNDGSHDSAYERVVAPHGSRIDYRVLPENGGCGAARRACFEGAKEDYLVSIDDDCLPSAEWLDWLEAMIASYPGVDFFAGDVKPYFAGEPTTWQRALSVLDEEHSQAIGPHGLMTAVTANLAVKRTIYEAVGGFASDLRGSEDCDLTQRMMAAGAAYRVCFDWIILHVAQLSYRKVARRFWNYGFFAARYAVARRTWRLNHAIATFTIWQALVNGYAIFRDRRNWDAQRKDLSATAKWMRALINGLLVAEMGMGSARVMRENGFSSKADLVQPPKLTARYVDFSSDDVAALWAGDMSR